jgi:hypothetical protein
VNFDKIFKTIDLIMGVGDIVGNKRDAATPSDSLPAAAEPGAGGPLERTLTNVLVAALKEAFDRDHTRLELERTQIEEQKRLAEEAMRMEQRRQALDRELGRLRLLAGAAITGWIVAVVLLVMRVGHAPQASIVVLAFGCLLLLGSLGSAFTAQRHIGSLPADRSPQSVPAAVLTLWLLLAGLALSAGSLLF